jgi:hypothetical protein
MTICHRYNFFFQNGQQSLAKPMGKTRFLWSERSLYKQPVITRELYKKKSLFFKTK